MPEPQVSAEASHSDRITIPDEKYAPEPDKRPSYKRPVKNFADNEETVGKTLSWLKGFLGEFNSRQQWDKFEEQMDVDDEMYRAAVNRTQLNSDESDNVQDTGSKVKSSSYYSDIRSITTGESAVLIGNEQELPVEYEPLPNATEYSEDEGLRIAEDQNMMLAHDLDKGRMRDDIRRTLLRMNKYGNGVIEMDWDYRKEYGVEERKPVYEDVIDPETGEVVDKRIKSVKWTKRDKVIADNPVLVVHDMKDVRFDTAIPNAQDQSCIDFRFQKQLIDIYGMQKVGDWMNVGKVREGHLYAGENSDSNILEERQSNAGEDGDSEKPTTLYDCHRGYIRLPVDPETGKWEPEKQVPVWFRYVFVGDINKNPVCVQLRPNIHKSKRIPVRFTHSHEDDKGAISMSYGVLVKSLIAQEMTTMDQYVDNHTKNLRPAWILERGSLSIRDKTFSAGGNRVWWKVPGSQDPHEVKVQDMTGNVLPMLKELEERRRRAMGINRPFLGEPLGSRTSASEATIDFEQALKPALEDAKFKANQILPFIAEWVYELDQQFGDPQRRLAITYQNEQREVKPGYIWGPLRVRVTAVKKFQDSLIRRREEDNLLNVIMPQALPFMKPEGAVRMFSQVLKNRGFDDVDSLWKVESDYDAKHVAKSENQMILFEGVVDFPKPEENHDAHLAEHKPFLATYTVSLAKEEQSEENLRNMKQHILMHEQMKSQAQATAQTPTPEGGEARTTGEVQGDMMGAEAGAAENQGPGRPPIFPGQEGIET